MSKSTMSRTVQKQIVKDGVIIGTVAAVRATIQLILKDSRFRHIEAIYSPNPNPANGKEPGTKYTVLACGGGPVKGVLSSQKAADRIVNNDLITVYAADRRGWRSLKVTLITSVKVYTGEQVPNPRKAGCTVDKLVAIPVIVLGVDK